MIYDTIALAEGEIIVATIRRHWFSLAVIGAFNIFVFLCVVGGVIFVDAVLLTQDDIVISEGILPLGFFVIGFVGLLLWMHFFASWSDHWLDTWIVTNRRVVDIEQKGFFTRVVSSFPLDRIQDVTYTVSGIIPTWLHFGDVKIQTASISDDLIMRQVPFPQDIKEHLIEVLDKK